MTPSTKLSVSIIIPNFNGENLLNKHMPDVINASNGAQIIVVDDASTDGSRELIKQSFPNVMLLCLPKNLRFAAACNAGVKKASGEIIVLLNTDVSPKSDFLNYLVKEFAD